MTASLALVLTVGAVAVVFALLLLVEPRAALSRRRRVQALLGELGATPQPGALARSLGELIGDSRCAVAYPLDGKTINADGECIDLPVVAPGRVMFEGEPRTVTRVTRGDETVALLLHDPGLVGAADLTRRIGDAARLAIDNEHLAAALRARVRELQNSRRRVVERGDDDRHRLERNLHDGAQQLLVSLAIDLRAAGFDAPPEAAAALSEAARELKAALEDVRSIAHGIFPTILSEAGLRSALERLADGAPVPLTVEGDDPGRMPAQSEHAAYAIVNEAVERAALDGVDEVSVELVFESGQLTLRVDPASVAFHALDRAAAAGGSTKVDGSALRVTLAAAGET